MSGELSTLSQLGANPLGAWLFSQPSLYRGVMQIAMVRAEHVPALSRRLSRLGRHAWDARTDVEGEPVRGMLRGAVLLPLHRLPRDGAVHGLLSEEGVDR